MKIFTAIFICAATAATAAPVSFKNDIAPLLLAKCQACHGAKKAKGEYRVDSYAELMKSLEDEQPRVIAEKPDESLLLKLLNTNDVDERMPQKSKPLSKKQVALVYKWIMEGAKFDGKDVQTALVQLVPSRIHAAAPKKYLRPLPITAMSFSPNGQRLAISGLREITVWNPVNGKLLQRIPNMAQRTLALKWSQDGETVFAGGGIPGELGEVRAFNTTNGNLRAVIHRVSDMVLDVQLDLNGTTLAVADADNLITLYDTNDFSQTLQIDNHSDWVMAIAFSKDNKHLASASRDRTAKIFELKTGLAISTYGGHGAPVSGVAFSTNGKQIFSAGHDKKIHVWKTGLADIEGKRFGAEKVGEITGFNRRVYKITTHNDVLFSPSADGRVRQHQATNRKLVREFEGDDDWTLTLAHHGATKRIAVGGYGGVVRIFDTATGKLLKVFRPTP